MAALWRKEVMLRVRVNDVDTQDAAGAGLDFDRSGGCCGQVVVAAEQGKLLISLTVLNPICFPI